MWHFCSMNKWASNSNNSHVYDFPPISHNISRSARGKNKLISLSRCLNIALFALLDSPLSGSLVPILQFPESRTSHQHSTRELTSTISTANIMYRKLNKNKTMMMMAMMIGEIQNEWIERSERDLTSVCCGFFGLWTCFHLVGAVRRESVALPGSCEIYVQEEIKNFSFLSLIQKKRWKLLSTQRTKIFKFSSVRWLECVWSEIC